ncbi:hypothetical protein D3C75_837900 [compost metagenome]
MEFGDGPPIGSQADPPGSQQLPHPAQDPALCHHRVDRDGTGMAVLRLSRCGRHRHADPDLRVAGPGPEHRGRPGRPARPRLRRLLCRRRLQLCPALALLRPGLLDLPADRRGHGRAVRLPARFPGAASARRLPGDRHPRLRRDHPHPAAQHDLADRRAQRHQRHRQADPVRPDLRAPRPRGHADLPRVPRHRLQLQPQGDPPLPDRPAAGTAGPAGDQPPDAHAAGPGLGSPA